MDDLKAMAGQIRRDILRMVHAVQSGHPGGSLGCVDFFTVLYFKIIKRKPGFDMNGYGEDVFFYLTGIFRRYFIAPWREPAISL